MNQKKSELCHEGARVRVANCAYSGAERWTNALVGTVASLPEADGVQVLVDACACAAGTGGTEREMFVTWPMLDVEQKPRHQWLDLPLTLIRPSRWQYRRHFDANGLRELAHSIEQHGLINRLLVFKHEDGQHYEVIAGERRLRALCALALCHHAGNLAGTSELVAATSWWDDAPAMLSNVAGEARTAPCELRTGTAEDFREIVILENLQRQDPSPVEEAQGFQTLIEAGYTQTKLAQRLGKSQGYISQRLGLLDLAESVRETVHDQGLSFTAARAIATLPESVQPAVAAHVQELARTQVDAAATTRQVQAMASQIRRFLDPASWDPPADQVLDPKVYNRLRLVRHHVATIDPALAGEAVIELRQVNHYACARAAGTSGQASNLTGKKPLAIANDGYEAGKVVALLTGNDSDQSDTHFWHAAALAQGWICEHCLWHDVARPAKKMALYTLCQRWHLDVARDSDGVPRTPERAVSPSDTRSETASGRRDRDEQRKVITCLSFIGAGDPIVLPLEGNAEGWIERLKLEATVHKMTEHRSYYATDFETWLTVQEQVAQAEAEETARRDRERSQAHLPALMAYWAAQVEAETPMVDRIEDLHRGLYLTHSRACACRRCVHFRPDLPDKDAERLPPCRFAVEPIQRYSWSHETSAPTMGVLVRRDGLMIPVCEEFHVAEIPAIAPLRGFAFPEEHQAVVLEWLHGIAKRGYGGSYGHNAAVPGILSWLPFYERAEQADIDRLLRYVKKHWDELGRAPGIAQLLRIAMSEAVAGAKHQEPIDLVDIITGTMESWCSISWEQYTEGRAPYRERWSEGWPQPWVRKVTGNG